MSGNVHCHYEGRQYNSFKLIFVQPPYIICTKCFHYFKNFINDFNEIFFDKIDPVPIRDCTTDSDCLDTPYTSCAIDSSDRKRRCLCADGKQPQNGECLKKPRGMRSMVVLMYFPWRFVQQSHKTVGY